MGIQTNLTLNEINAVCKKEGLLFVQMTPTTHGITDSTYIAQTKQGIRYVLKLYEEATFDEVFEEVDFLNRMKNLNVVKVVSKKIRSFKGKPFVIFEFLKGHEPQPVLLSQLRQIGTFLAMLHDKTYNMKFSNTYRYSHKDLKQKIQTIVHEREIYVDVKKAFQVRYKKVEHLKFNAMHIIHGDLFPDNTKFSDDQLMGVFDFSNLSKNDKRLDLAVVINAWCFDEKNELDMPFVKGFLEEYNFFYDENLSVQKLKPFIQYMALYYAVSRFKSMYVDKKEVYYKSYKEYLQKFDYMESL
jgi:homoserine kinase type II